MIHEFLNDLMWAVVIAGPLWLVWAVAVRICT